MNTSDQPILSVRHLSLETGVLSLRSLLLERKLFRKTSILKNISFELGRGECLVIMDDGRSHLPVLIEILAGLRKQTSGLILCSGKVLTADNPRRNSIIRPIFARSDKTLENGLDIGTTLDIPLRFSTELRADERAARIRRTLELLRLPPDIVAEHAWDLSPVENMRVSLARALVLKPRILVSNSAFMDLAPAIRAEMMNISLRLRSEYHITQIFAARNIDIARKISDRILILANGAVEEFGETDQVLGNPQAAGTKKILENFSTRYRYSPEKS